MVLVDLVPLVFKVFEDLLGEEGLEEHQDQWENLEIMDKMERMGNPEFKESLEDLVRLDSLEIRDLEGNKVQKVPLVFQGLQESEGIQEKMGFQEKQDYLVQLDLLEREVCQDLQGLGVSKVCLDQLAKMGNLEKMEKQECKVRQV